MLIESERDDAGIAIRIATYSSIRRQDDTRQVSFSTRVGSRACRIIRARARAGIQQIYRLRVARVLLSLESSRHAHPAYLYRNTEAR